jgi:hypothetical protein
VGRALRVSFRKVRGSGSRFCGSYRGAVDMNKKFLNVLGLTLILSQTQFSGAAKADKLGDTFDKMLSDSQSVLDSIDKENTQYADKHHVAITRMSTASRLMLSKIDPSDPHRLDLIRSLEKAIKDLARADGIHIDTDSVSEPKQIFSLGEYLKDLQDLKARAVREKWAISELTNKTVDPVTKKVGTGNLDKMIVQAEIAKKEMEESLKKNPKWSAELPHKNWRKENLKDTSAAKDRVELASRAKKINAETPSYNELCTALDDGKDKLPALKAKLTSAANAFAPKAMKEIEVNYNAEMARIQKRQIYLNKMDLKSSIEFKKEQWENLFREAFEVTTWVDRGTKVDINVNGKSESVEDAGFFNAANEEIAKILTVPDFSTQTINGETFKTFASVEAKNPELKNVMLSDLFGAGISDLAKAGAFTNPFGKSSAELTISVKDSAKIKKQLAKLDAVREEYKALEARKLVVESKAGIEEFEFLPVAKIEAASLKKSQLKLVNDDLSKVVVSDKLNVEKTAFEKAKSKLAEQNAHVAKYNAACNLRKEHDDKVVGGDFLSHANPKAEENLRSSIDSLKSIQSKIK